MTVFWRPRLGRPGGAHTLAVGSDQNRRLTVEVIPRLDALASCLAAVALGDFDPMEIAPFAVKLADAARRHALVAAQELELRRVEGPPKPWRHRVEGVSDARSTTEL